MARQRRGKQRKISTIILLSIVTLGIYTLVWRYEVHQEIYERFNLKQEGHKNGKPWFWIGWLLFAPLMLLYEWIFVSNVQRVRQRLGIREGITPGGYLGLVLFPSVVLLSFQIFLQVRRLAPEDLVTATGEPTSLFWTILTVIGATALVGMVLFFVAMSKVQRDANRIWQVAARGGPTSARVPSAAATAPPAVRQLKCPRCTTVVQVPAGTRPSCGACGFGA